VVLSRESGSGYIQEKRTSGWYMPGAMNRSETEFKERGTEIEKKMGSEWKCRRRPTVKLSKAWLATGGHKGIYTE
jgi:hypothetical protein